MLHRKTCIMFRLLGASAFIFALAFAQHGWAQQGYEIGDFESVSPIIGGANGPTFTATAADPPHTVTEADGTTLDYYGMWSDSGDIQRQYFSADLYNQVLTTEGATHGSTAVLTNQIPPDGGYHHILQLDSSGTSPTTTALMHASALKFDATFDPAQLPVATPGTNTFAFFVAVIQVRALDATSGSGYFQGKPSYDSFTIQDASGNVITQPNYDAGQYNPADTTDYPPGSKVTVSVTLDFTKDRPNAAGGGPNPTTPDTFDPPSWKTFHDTMVSDYNTNGAATDFSNIHLLFDTGNGFSASGIYVDNIRLIEPGDFNQDGHVDAADIKAGAAALANLSAYETASHMSSYDMKLIGDVNGDGLVNNADLQTLIADLKTGGVLNPVPEPGSLLLLGFSAALMFGTRKRKIKTNYKKLTESYL